MASSVTIDFQANLARFTSQIDKATNDLSKFQTNAQRMSNNLSKTFSMLGAGLSVGAFGAMIKGSIDAADALNDLSQKVGISVKELAKYELASKQSGTNLESFGKGIKGLAGNMVEHGDALRKAGITATDADGAMRQLADLFKSTPDDVEKTTLAVKLFGKSGMDMIPMLNLGSEGLEKSAKSAARYAEIMQTLAPGADRFNDQLAELKLNSSASTAALAANMIPTLNNFLEQMIEGTRIAGGFGAALVQFGTINPFKNLAENLKTTREELDKLKTGKLDLFQFGMTDFEKNKKITSLQKDLEFLNMQQRQNLPQASYSNEGWGLRTDRTLEIDAIKKRQQLLKDLGGMGGDNGERARMLDLDKKGWVALAEFKVKESEETLVALNKITTDRNDYEEKMRAEDLKGQVAYYDAIVKKDFENTAQIAKDQIDKLKEVNAGTKTAEEFARDMGLSFSSAFEDAVIGGKKFSDVLKGLSADIARIIMRKTITEPFGTAISGMVKGFNFADLFKAEGGPVSGGQSYIVGERGPEVFTPMGSGNITPNSKVGGTTNNFAVDMRGASVEAVVRLEQLVMSVNGSIERRVMSVMGQARMRGA